MRIAIIGGGLAGLTAAAYLSDHNDTSGTVFERSPQLGGRAFTYEKSGFTLNYGAHAVYGIDRHTLHTMEEELHLKFQSKQVDKRKVMYAKHGRLTPAPLDFFNIMKTDVLSAKEKIRFVAEIAAVIGNIHHLKQHRTLGDYLDHSHASADVKELWEHLVCSNFFITPEEARKVSGEVIAEYYHNLFLSGRPVSYILGSWATITDQLIHKIGENKDWEIAVKEPVESITMEDGKFVLNTKTRQQLVYDQVIFAMPVQQVTKLLENTPWASSLEPFKDCSSTEVLVYDVGFSKVVNRPFHYISDMDHKIFISDVSATDYTVAPVHGQLLQGIAYLNDDFTDEEQKKQYLEQKTQQMEALFDTYYPNWREFVEVKRVSKKAMVASVKNIHTNKLLPNRVAGVPFLFCGDGCEGKGELAERAFSSGRTVAQAILEQAQTKALSY
ncbi:MULTISPECIES: FAD-dependent oxidoreductase [Paenibacillus]|jgi:protoporphyrinogen oxidase|uniref:FAD-dependent oxidoreductase n=1 Tax=Paenibacillus TaxID=44249 RepID=UPI00073E88C1|nr:MULTISPECIES: FAD-dependent oxidoreductase [Paenibacillus]MDU4698558.1 FAD-dependent oxidoreductase [Paenibacillus sp.]